MNNIYDQPFLQSLDSEINFTYTIIVNYIQKFLNRTDVDTINAIPQYISLGENRLALDLKLLSGVNVTQFIIPLSEFPLNAPYSVIIKKPVGWRTTKSMGIVTLTNNRSYIYPRSVEYIQTYMNDFNVIDLNSNFNYAELIFYADYDQSNWLIGPINTINPTTIEVQYFSEINSLSSTNPTNYFTQYAPRALIYSSLVEASAFLRSDSRVAMWEQTYQDTINKLKTENVLRFNDNIIVRSN